MYKSTNGNSNRHQLAKSFSMISQRDARFGSFEMSKAATNLVKFLFHTTTIFNCRTEIDSINKPTFNGYLYLVPQSPITGLMSVVMSSIAMKQPP